MISKLFTNRSLDGLNDAINDFIQSSKIRIIAMSHERNINSTSIYAEITCSAIIIYETVAELREQQIDSILN